MKLLEKQSFKLSLFVLNRLENIFTFDKQYFPIIPSTSATLYDISFLGRAIYLASYSSVGNNSACLVRR